MIFSVKMIDDYPEDFMKSRQKDYERFKAFDWDHKILRFEMFNHHGSDNLDDYEPGKKSRGVRHPTADNININQIQQNKK